jgi:hypothetical protein
MNTLTRTLITGGTAVAVFATSWAITSAVTGEDPQTPIDAPIAVPASSIEQATVLMPVAAGENPAEASASDEGLSASAGTGSVVVLDAEPGEPAEGAPPVGAPPAVLAAAAALDSAAGDPADTLPITPEGFEPFPSAPLPEPDPASDPCALEDAPEEDCPDGAHVTLFELRPGEALEVWASADPVPGPGMGTSIWCTPEELATGVPEGALALGALANDNASVTVTYWPASDPTATTTVTLTQVATLESGAETFSRHCGVTGALEDGRYEGSAFGINADGVISEPWPIAFDSRGRPTDPPMRAIPLGTNWLWVGVYHTSHDTADIRGFVLADGGPVDCQTAYDDRSYGLTYDVWPHTSEITGDWLRARNFNHAYTRVTSTLLYVPEGESAGICGLTFAEGDPSWDTNVPEKVQYLTVSAPDTYEAVVTLRDITVYGPGHVSLSATGQTGSTCGTRFDQGFTIEASDTPRTTEYGYELCALAGQNITVTANTTYPREGGGVEDGRSAARFMLLGAACTGVCPEPAPQTYNVFLPGLGQDECPDSATGDCQVRRRVSGAVARIDITWRSSGEGGAEDWNIGTSTQSDPREPASDVPQFDLAAFPRVTVADDGFHATGTVTFKWDRDVTWSAQLLGDCFNGEEGADAPAAATGRTRPAGTGVFEATMNFAGLCTGEHYRLVVTATDMEGNVTIAGPASVAGVTPASTWLPGNIVVPPSYLEVTAKVEVFTADNMTASWLVLDSWVYFDGSGPEGTSLSPSFGSPQSERCFPGSSHREGSAPATSPVLPLEHSYTVTHDINVITDWFYGPRSATCAWRSYTRWISPEATTVTLTQLLAGTEIRGTLVDSDFPDFTDGQLPFTYRIVLRAERVDS